jgi:glycosyltransferase involved in cell wall biosynthesis
MTSVVIAAHNEAAVIGRCLDALMGQDVGQEPLDITVAANGCSDTTAKVAGQRGVRVVEVDEANKALALNVGDAVARGFPRIYLDADIVVPPGGIVSINNVFQSNTQPLAAVPRRRLDVSGRPLLVRAYFAICGRLPVYDQALIGRGLIALSAEGRSRFDEFPIMLADDLFLDSLFADTEKEIATSVEVAVATPWRTRDLLRRLVRVRHANAAMRGARRTGAVSTDVRGADRFAWLRDVVLPRPWLGPAGAVYASICVMAAVLARRDRAGAAVWGRDESTRDAARLQDIDHD